MNPTQHTYIAIDLKSFFASVECVERGLDPLTTNLVVADASRTEKTICLAVTPSLKAYGIGGRARLFEVVQRVREVNRQRWHRSYAHCLSGKSSNARALEQHPDWEVDYIVAPPRMAYYIEYSRRIYEIYLKYIAPEDIHVYSIDEVFIDVTSYLLTYRMTAHELAMTIIRDVLKQTGITATAGIGTNLYLCKIAMDIVAKHLPADKDGVRIAELDEMEYRRRLWDYKPLTKFWRVGKGIAERLAPYGIDTMGKIARCSLENEDLLYRLFGMNAELLIDHAWGWEPCTMQAVKAYRPETNSFSTGQVFQCAYDFRKARVVIREMADAAALDLVSKWMVTDQLVMTVGYDIECLTDPAIRCRYHGCLRTRSAQVGPWYDQPPLSDCFLKTDFRGSGRSFRPDRADRPAHPSAEPEHQSCGGRIGKESAAAPTGAAGPLHRLQCGGSPAGGTVRAAGQRTAHPGNFVDHQAEVREERHPARPEF